MNSFNCGNKLINEKIRSQSDRYHQQRLTEIKKSKGKESTMVSRPDNRKGQMMAEDRRQQIEKENAVLLDKMSKIMDKRPEFYIAQSTKLVRRGKIQAQLQLENEKATQRIRNARSSYSHDKSLPSWMSVRMSTKVRSRQVRNSHQEKSEAESRVEEVSNPARQTFERTMSFLRSLRKDSTMKEKKQMQDRFNKPQQMYERVVLFKKSCVLPEGNFLVEISAAYGKLIFLVYDMLNPKNIRRLVMSEEKTHKILNECQYDYEKLATQVVIYDDGIALVRKLQQVASVSGSRVNETSDPPKSAFEQQKQFLQRNFYVQIEKMKKKAEQSAKMFREPEDLAAAYDVHRLNSSHQRLNDKIPVATKPATGLANIRKKFKYEIPKNKRKLIANSTAIKEEKTESDQPESRPNVIINSKIKQQIQEDLSPILKPKKIQSSHDDYLDQEYENQFDQYAQKPASRQGQHRQKSQQDAYEQNFDKSDSQLQPAQNEDEDDQQYEQDPDQKEEESNQEQKPDESEDEYAQQQLQLSGQGSKEALRYQQDDFQISQSKA